MVQKKKIIGTLAPIFSLTSNQQSPQDQGTFASGLYFLDWLKKTGQNAWQILPLNETQLEKGSATKHVPSPYKGYGIGLSPKYLSSSFAHLKPSQKEKNAFIVQHKDWLEDYVLFCSIRDVYGTDDWRTWDKRLRSREKGALKEWSKKYKAQIDYYIVQQWQLQKSYKELHNKAKAMGISLIGDLPYYLSVHSPLVWAHQQAFQIHKDGTLPHVSGIPMSPGTYFGRQVWGHPLYNWENKEHVLDLWKMRIIYQAVLFEDIRFDHAKAFFQYGVMDSGNENHDRYEVGPGGDVFKEIIEFSQKRGLFVFAEDSGDGTGGLRKYLNSLQIAGIKIYYFAMKPNENQENEKYAYIPQYPKNCVAYTTTHDTETMLGYMKLLTPEQKQKLALTAKVTYVADDKALARSLRDAIIASSANIVIIPIQDWLMSAERINIPGTEKEVDDPNWHYKLPTVIEELPQNV